MSAAITGLARQWADFYVNNRSDLGVNKQDHRDAAEFNFKAVVFDLATAGVFYSAIKIALCSNIVLFGLLGLGSLFLRNEADQSIKATTSLNSTTWLTNNVKLFDHLVFRKLATFSQV